MLLNGGMIRLSEYRGEWSKLRLEASNEWSTTILYPEACPVSNIFNKDMEAMNPCLSVLQTPSWKDQLTYLEGRAAIKGDLDSPWEWSKRNLMQFNKCRDCLTVLHAGH